MKTVSEQISKNNLISLLDHTDDLLSLVDTEFVYCAANQAYTRKYNKSLDQIIGHKVWEVMGEESFETVIKPNLLRAFKGEKIHYEAWFDTLEGKSKSYMRVNYNPLYDENKKIDGVVVTASDITAMKIIEEEQKIQEKMLIETSRMAQIGEMIAFISHQWRQPLNTLSTYLLRLRCTVNAEKSSIEIIERSESILEHLSQSLESLYAFYADNYDDEPADIKICIEQAALLIEERLKSQNIILSSSLEDALTVSLHSNELLHVLLVVIENAIDALSETEQSDKQISISAHKESGQIIVDIHDNGDGISVEHLDKVFDAGFTTKTGYRGHGYGLYFAQKVIAKEGKGKLEVFAEESGSHFRITLMES